MIEATVLSGSMNIFEVRGDDGSVLQCRIKGKVLKGAEGAYNALAPGDRVVIDLDPHSPGKGSVVSLLERRNAFTRWNQKGKSSQVIAANLDLVICVTSPAEPPFRPRFLDRALLQCDVADIPSIILVNKDDLDQEDPDLEERLDDFHRLGYQSLRFSALKGTGLQELEDLIRDRTVALVGQSGVGKSTIVNLLCPHAEHRVGAISEKWERGSHTTVMARLVPSSNGWEGGRIIDTPGVRRLVPDGVDSSSLPLYLREFAPLIGSCSYGASCSHLTEPGCKILEAVYSGVIHEDRYESFLRMREELDERTPSWERSK